MQLLWALEIYHMVTFCKDKMKKGIVPHFRKCANRRSCTDLNERIDAIAVFAMTSLSYDLTLLVRRKNQDDKKAKRRRSYKNSKNILNKILKCFDAFCGFLAH